jgi:poly(3-hydroxybutyrate) depolymerase
MIELIVIDELALVHATHFAAFGPIASLLAMAAQRRNLATQS